MGHIYLNFFAFNYNISKNSTNNYQYSPYEIVYKRKPLELSEVLNGNVEPNYDIENYVKEAKQKMQIVHKNTIEILNKTKHQNKAYYDKNANPLDICVGQSVRIKKEPYDKFKLIYSEPYEVVEVNEPNVTLKVNNKLVTIHKNRVIRA